MAGNRSDRWGSAPCGRTSRAGGLMGAGGQLRPFRHSTTRAEILIHWQADAVSFPGGRGIGRRPSPPTLSPDEPEKTADVHSRCCILDFLCHVKASHRLDTGRWEAVMVAPPCGAFRKGGIFW